MGVELDLLVMKECGFRTREREMLKKNLVKQQEDGRKYHKEDIHDLYAHLVF
jgi:hypothetical protein